MSDKEQLWNWIYQQMNCNVKMGFGMFGREVIATFQASRSFLICPLLLGEFVFLLKISQMPFLCETYFVVTLHCYFSSLFFTMLL